MSDFERVAFVDGLRPNGRVYWEGRPGELRGGLLPSVLGCDALKWVERDDWDVEKYDLFILLYFAHQTRAMRWIKARRPDALVVPWVDAGVDVLFNPATWSQREVVMVNQIKEAADAVASWDPHGLHGQFMAMLTGKPAVELPIPLMPNDNLEALRNTPKEDLIIGWLHKQKPRQPGATLATLAALQRETGYQVIVMDAYSPCEEMALNFGLDAHFVHRRRAWAEKLELLSRAKLLVDLYTIHHYGRVATHAANVGTVSISSLHTANVGHIRVDPWSDEGYRAAMYLLDNPAAYEDMQLDGYRILAERHDPGRIRAIVQSWLDGDLS